MKNSVRDSKLVNGFSFPRVVGHVIGTIVTYFALFLQPVSADNLVFCSVSGEVSLPSNCTEFNGLFTGDTILAASGTHRHFIVTTHRKSRMAQMTNNSKWTYFDAEGFGADTKGGLGGDIVKVTNLNDSGEGSLRWALEELEGPRIVLFDVSGEIALSDQIQLNGEVTVVGESSPGGITITGARLRVVESEVIITGMNFRPGDGDGDTPSNRDGVSIGKRGETVENVVVDGNSFSWSVDEQISVWGGASKVTISNNIFAEALRDSIHEKGAHSMGVLVGDGSSEVTITKNLLAHNEFRNATVVDSTKVEFINNVVYNYGANGFLGSDDTTAHVIGNVYLAGEDSAGRAPIRTKDLKPGSEYFFQDNMGEVDSNPRVVSDSYVFKPSNVTVLSAKNTQDHVLANAGARSSGLSPIDERIIDSVTQGTGSFVDSPDDVGGYSFGTGKALRDRDNDGIPDEFEALIGSNASKFDSHDDANGDGNSNIDAYFEVLRNGFVPVGNTNPTESAPKDAPTPTQGEGGGTSEPAKPKPPSDDGVGINTGSSIRIEAEDFDNLDGFVVQENEDASNGAVLQAKSRDVVEASHNFEGKGGTYDIAVSYFDETDGVSSLALKLNGKTLGEWDFDDTTGSELGNILSLKKKVISGVELKPGDLLSFSGMRDGKEPLRIDAVDLFQTQPAKEENVSRDDASLKVEAEDFELVSGFRVESNVHADGGAVIRGVSDKGSKARLEFEGKSSTYDLALNYFDESDGTSEIEIFVDGRSVAAWTWDSDPAGDIVNRDAKTTFVVNDVSLNGGSIIEFIGMRDDGEALRIDSIEFVPTFDLI